MKILETVDKKAIIILDENEELEISTLKKNKEKVVIKCIDSTLHVDELSIEHLKKSGEEKKAIEAMQKFLRMNRKK